MVRIGETIEHGTPAAVAAIALLYERQAGRLYAYVLRRVREPMDADDVVAETFRRAVEHVDHRERRAVPVSAWLYRVARNVIADWYRRAATLPLDLAADVPDADPGPEQALLRGERRRAVWAAVDTLPPGQRRVLWLRYGCGLRYREIGRALGQGEGTIKVAAHRARDAVRVRLAAPALTVEEKGHGFRRRGAACVRRDRNVDSGW